MHNSVIKVGGLKKLVGGKCCVKKCVFSSFLNMAGLAAAQMSGGSEFHAAGPAC